MKSFSFSDFHLNYISQYSPWKIRLKTIFRITSSEENALKNPEDKYGHNDTSHLFCPLAELRVHSCLFTTEEYQEDAFLS